MTKALDLSQIDRPAPRYQAILDRDGDRVPDVLRLDSNPIPATDPIDFSRYTSREFHDREMAKMWSRVWQFACREEHVANRGDYYVYEIGRWSLIVSRDEGGVLKAYYNSCLHRGTKLKPSNGRGSAGQIQCPYHGWTWNLGGDLVKVPCAWDFPHLNYGEMRLPEARVATWNGLVFVNLSDEGPDLLEYLEVLPEHFGNWGMTDWYVSVHARKELPCNWKAAQDAFIEAYHTNLIHPQCVGTAGDINAQHDIFGDHVSRDLVALGVSSPSLAAPLGDQEILDMMLLGDGSIIGERPRLKEGETARSVMAGNMRETFRDQFGLDLSGRSTAELIDSIKYTLFPNLFIFAGISLRVLYVYRPLGDDPNRSTFDILFMRPMPKGGERPEPAELVLVGEEDSYRDVPGMDPGFGELFDQDTGILRAQRDGML
ncbi:MAG TPA: aromatic ring-hydroxylating dioxygenase subunit alpha, partial [Stellaceae bacterium]|nr:aromatic ring-hydroxylating dioxygenase subunit alpha [Stellaceae bacterium]